jgi:hypothetical protein
MAKALRSPGGKPRVKIQPFQLFFLGKQVPLGDDVRSAAERRAEAVVLRDLKAAGVEAESLDDLLAARGQYDQALPALLAHVNRRHSIHVRAACATCLDVPNIRRHWDSLVACYRRCTSTLVQNALAQVISFRGERKHAASMAALVRLRGKEGRNYIVDRLAQVDYERLPSLVRRLSSYGLDVSDPCIRKRATKHLFPGKDGEFVVERSAADRRSEAAVLRHLRQAGISVAKLSDLWTARGQHDEAIPILLAHVNRRHTLHVRQQCACGLNVPGVRRHWQRLVEAYRRCDAPRVEACLAEVLSVWGKREHVESMAALARLQGKAGRHFLEDGLLRLGDVRLLRPLSG